MARSKRVTLKDVCEVAGVSLGTASRVLNKTRTPNNVSPATAERVRAVADRLGYRCCSAASAMRNGRRNAIAYIQTPATQPTGIWHCLMAATLEVEGKDQFLIHTILPSTHLDPENLPRVFQRDFADGAILRLDHSVPASILERLRRYDLPWILANEKREEDCVYADDYTAGVDATQKLIELGHRKIAYIDWGFGLLPDDEREYSHYSRLDRLNGYLKAVDAADLSPQPLIRQQARDEDTRSRELHRLFSVADHPTALVTQMGWSSRYTEVLAECGLTVPRDVSVMSLAMSADHAAGMAGTVIDWRAIGRTAAEMILARIETGDSLPARVIPHKLKEGATCAAVPALT